MRVVISAGGKGSRIASVASDIPKPMIPVCGKPVLQHQIEWLKRQGFEEVYISISHLGFVIRDRFGDGADLGVRIHYIEEKEPLGTGGALFYLHSVKEPILLVNGDVMLDVDIARMLCFHQKNSALATLLTHPNQHPYDSGLIFADACGRVTNWLHREDAREDYRNRVNAGVHLIEPEVVAELLHATKLDLDRELLQPLIKTGRLFAYDSPEYVRDMGTPQRYRRVCDDCALGRIQQRNLANQQRAFFLDRDGTINQKDGFITRPDQIVLLPGAADAIRLINESGYLAIVVTNQPVIARGDCTIDELNAIHMRLERLLGEQGAYIDALYYCPHHPDRGFPGERVEYKTDCACRKPKPGLLLDAAKKYNIDMFRSCMIGDEEKDVQAGTSAGCGQSVKLLPDMTLYDVVKGILSGGEGS